MAERDKLILGARAPSPARSAKRETVTASRSLRLSVLPTLRRARAPALPVLTGSFQIGSTFWAKPVTVVDISKGSVRGFVKSRKQRQIGVHPWFFNSSGR